MNLRRAIFCAVVMLAAIPGLAAAQAFPAGTKSRALLEKASLKKLD